MNTSNPNLHILLFPFLAHGHIIPTIDMAKLFATKGVKSTIVTTPLNASLISKAIEKSKPHHHNVIQIQTIEFPCEEAGLPKGCENMDSVPSQDLFLAFFHATSLLQKPFEELLLEQHPHCVIADAFYSWATDSASKFGIPRIVFHGTCFFSLCASDCMGLYEPHKNVSSDSDSFLVPCLPGEIKMTRKDVPAFITNKENSTEFVKLLEDAKEAQARSYGVVVNSFYELENVYADFYKNEFGRKAWPIGPVSLCNKDTGEKANRAKETTIDEFECLKWLDTKKPNSVVYVSFGSLISMPDSQLREIALSLEISGQHFIWLVKKNEKDGAEWLPKGFEKRMEGKGLIIRGWAPQILILEHQAVGAFVTHCGWNSTLEAVAAGVPMITWPIVAEQFFNEKLVTEVLEIGVPVEAVKGVRLEGECVGCDALEKALKRVMIGEEAEEMRNKVKVLAQLAKQAVEENGSSYIAFNALIQELVSLSLSR
ncbi:hypothetical protein HN51_016522 [Arachis hypogaea]|uniref:Glycosyltransferase n=4 Tax=Arachis hypogaea TaxID=3818 RepID=A0A445CT39_ARAHY|nr:UDP-glucose flavonoid 3-O-glucosyltransferase 7 [Arachis hypogaea]QHO47109.1 Scopoletin glucosyltransferase [Arachis hypogaea]RYR54146.1 hypothetical protein Ahy_A06g029398 isoform C [Arachis hypogaea]